MSGQLKVEINSTFELVPADKPIIRLTCRYLKYLLNWHGLGDTYHIRLHRRHMRTEETTCSCRFFSSAVTPSRFCPTTAPEPTNLEITQGDMSPVTSVCGATATVSIQGK